MGIGRLIIFLSICFGLWLAFRWFIRTPPEQVSKTLVRVAIGTGILFLIMLAATGRLHPLFAAAGAAIGGLATLAMRLVRMPWALGLAQRLFYYYRAKKNSAEPSANQCSQVETHFVRMFLDHDNGEIGGEIIAGELLGFRLSQLDQAQLVALWQCYLVEDSESAALLEAYLNHAHGEEWRDQCEVEPDSGYRTPSPGGQMSTEEACKILGIEEGVDRETIIIAHRRLASKLHPDRGGSNYLAAQINRAKEALLAHHGE